MTYLLDTNVISELVKPSPCDTVVQWLKNQNESDLFISSITLAEILRGVTRLDEGKRKDRLIEWAETEIPKRFYSRILPFNSEAGILWGKWQGDADKHGKPFPVMDGQIASIAFHFGLVLVTRNTKDFSSFPIKFFNPWE